MKSCLLSLTSRSNPCATRETSSVACGTPNRVSPPPPRCNGTRKKGVDLNENRYRNKKPMERERAA
ncbi:hypothetical protein CPB85DRAFT_1328104 [Mucidula mucida]|nr:hypothetical protein CPB85DRAFT_1328104 [Mucidula mucida]